MRRMLLGGFVAVMLTGCSAPIVGTASPAPGVTSASAAQAGPPATQSRPNCLIGDTCGDESVTPAGLGLRCDDLASAIASFDQVAFGSRPSRASETPAEAADLMDVVQQAVDSCGFRVTADMANQYPTPLYDEVIADAIAALGEIAGLPGGLFCRDLRDLGLTVGNAVDYWFYWQSPANMDADLNGVPCETVWPDAGEYLPAWY